MIDIKGETKLFAGVFGIIAIVIGLVTIVKLVKVAELVVGFISLSFGILAIIWTVRARKSLSPGSELKGYTTYFLFSLIAILLFSIWDTALSFFQWQTTISRIFIYPKFVLITVTYFIFLIASYQILYMSKSFGFEVTSKKMDAILKARNKKKK